MRRGQDRFRVGEQVCELLFPGGSPHLRGVALGTPLDEALAGQAGVRQEGGAHAYELPVEDPHGNGRVVEVRLHAQLGRAQIVAVRFVSRDKMDVDTAWRKVKDHLDRVLGKADREVGGALTFAWRVPGEPEGRIRASRYKDQEMRGVLDISLRPDGG